MKIATLALVLGVLLVGCAEKPPEKILPTLPAKVNPVNVKWKVVAEVREIDGKNTLSCLMTETHTLPFHIPIR